MLLTNDRQLLQKFSGSINSALEQAVVKVTRGSSENAHPYIFGHILPVDSFLLTEEEASYFVLLNVRKYWGSVDLLTLSHLQSLQINTDGIHERLNRFLYSSTGKNMIVEYLILHHELTFESFISLIYGKEVKELPSKTGLQKLFLYKVGHRYLIHPIFKEHHISWHWLLVKKIYSTWLQIPLVEISHMQAMFNQLEQSSRKAFRHMKGFSNEFMMALDQCVTQVDTQNKNSVAKKILFMQRIVCYFRLSGGQDKRIEPLVHELKMRWSKGNVVLTEKELVLIAYVQFVVASHHRDSNQLLACGRYLLAHERLNNHAVEIMVEYKDILPSMKPTPHILVKSYDANYLEYILYTLIEALVENEKYQEAYNIIKEYEMASCEFIYLYVNDQYDDEDLYRMEATVQRDIAFIVDQSPQYVGASIETWRASYKEETSPYYKIAVRTSKHMCHMMKVLFAVEQFNLFERLMEIYKKYLLIDTHFDDMRQFIEQYVK